MDSYNCESERNRAVYTRVAESLYCDYGGKEQCPWTVAKLRGEFYFAFGVRSEKYIPGLNFSKLNMVKKH